MALRAGADGLVNATMLAIEECCPPSLCDLDVCSMMCSFINLLPNGPLWDAAKIKVMEKYKAGCHGILSQCDPCDPDYCSSLADFAVYKARTLYDMLMTALWPALREANPATAVTTMDEWLDRLGWVDCIRTACRDGRLGTLTPYEIMGICSPIYCPPEIPEDLACAVKHGIILSLSRLQMGIIKNLASINWVIEPLNARVTRLGNDTNCCDHRWQICQISPTIAACPPRDCPRSDSPTPVARIPASFTKCPSEVAAGLPLIFWPGNLAAECIARTLIPFRCTDNLIRCC